MKSKFVVAVAAVSGAALLSGCATDENGNAIFGALAGAAGGAALCALSGANDTECALLIAGGAALGGAIGNEIDRRDRERREAALQAALLSEEPVAIEWTNPETSNSGDIESLSVYRDSQGNTCRDFEETYMREGRQINDTYTICTSPDGSSFTR
jgi:surface antigen